MSLVSDPWANVAIPPLFAMTGDPRFLDRNTYLHALYLCGHFSDKRVLIIAIR